ncbi:hypothetical protein [Mucilaginibacter gotjawali]|uniref:Uncharacterized protein n=1 Tax=Mucilaginibacter gotjawali TaxID=1550579 RepID=A0A839SN98_9SPHI|nr:hypothetical protein [Mucilaginibacter gotjawali]MBB3059092.1 hypothetical protein [Mucilaginibacter gotjawali]
MIQRNCCKRKFIAVGFSQRDIRGKDVGFSQNYRNAWRSNYSAKAESL